VFLGNWAECAQGPFFLCRFVPRRGGVFTRAVWNGGEPNLDSVPRIGVAYGYLPVLGGKIAVFQAECGNGVEILPRYFGGPSRPVPKWCLSRDRVYPVPGISLARIGEGSFAVSPGVRFDRWNFRPDLSPRMLPTQCRGILESPGPVGSPAFRKRDVSCFS